MTPIESKKKFCIAGPIDPSRHYFIPKRLSWAHLDMLVSDMEYFILHAPRQSGKTTAVLEYVRHINKQNKWSALYLSTEPAHPANNDVERALYWLLLQLKIEIGDQLGKEHQIKALDFLNNALNERPVQEGSLYTFLHFWAQENTKPLILFFDEVDGLVENSLISLLKQFRTGYTKRPHLFPQSICLISVRSLQDYKLQSIEEKEKGILLSPFNVIADSLLLRNFTEEQLRDLYNQHTQATGQVFTDEALCYAYHLTQGQPWLTNALAYQACFRDITDRSHPITKEILEKAKEQLILRNDTHIGSLLDRLSEPCVRNIIDTIISGSSNPASLDPDDIQYVRDLGLLKEDGWEIANPIYKQVIPRALTSIIQELIPDQTSWYVDTSGKLNMTKLLASFTQFFRESADIYSKKIGYHESYQHLLLMAFLQRIVNGGGQIHREYALGRKRVDILVVWKNYKYILELKIKRGEDTLKKGLEQTANYVDLCKADEAHLIIFDQDLKKSWDEKISNETIAFNSQQIHIWNM